MGILLTDEEISKIRYKYNELYKGGVFEHTMRPNHCELVAKAQLKKVAELLKSCDGELVSRKEGPFMATFEMLATDYQALLEEAGLNKEV